MTSCGTSLSVLSVAAGLLLAGCGGAGEPGPYELAPTKECLEGADLRVSDTPPEFVSSTASGGALRVRFADIRVTLTFGESEREAARIARAYRQFAPKKFPIDDVLRTDRNVVELWEFAPQIEHLEILGGCLRS
ncbi:MAG: hypothetical protein ACRDN6_07575 [Gaiellaceae bacterium]